MIPLATADKFAEKILSELAPFCEAGHCQIAGSIRRRRPFVNDIDVVCLPAPGREVALRERSRRQAKRVVIDGPQTLVVVLANNLQIDIWIAQPAVTELLDSKPTNFGTLLLCRTGSMAHNIHLIEHAKSIGKVWNPYHGVFAPDGTGRTQCQASATEEDIFKALALDYIPPDRRER